ncbi:MAG TPA: ribonucleotide-diphosphate reductase subunit beta, partial [Ignavibacteriaceae bacterium]
MTELTQKKIFDELGDDSTTARQMINGSATGILNLNSVKYQWAPKLYKIMVNNFWIPEKISLVDDKVTIKELTKDEMEAFKNTLSFLIALDSMQVSNLPNIADYITAPEVGGLFTVQAFQELIHSQSYQYLLQELFPNTEREEIYNHWRNNPLLLKRNKFIAGQYQQFNDNKTIENLKIAIAANFALEGIYFYNGFQFFYQLA